MSDASNFDFGKFIPGFDFLQSLVKGAGAGANPLGKTPQWVAPTVSIEEVDKRITELKAVQFWLEQNGRALAATIQALEVQRMTLSTLKGMNVSMSELAKSFSFPAMGAGEQKEAQDQAPQNVFSQAMDWTRAAAASAQDFSRWAKPQHTEGEPAAAAEASDPTAMQAQAELFKAHATQAPSQGAEAAHKAQPQAEAAASSQEDAGQSTADAAKEVTEEMAAVQKAAVGQAMQWWGALTQQFQQIAAKAVAEPVSHQAMEAAQRAGDMASNLAKTAVQTATAATEKMVAKASANVQAASTAAANVAAHAGANVGAKSSKPAATQGAAKPAAKSAVKPVAKAAAKPAVKPDAKPAAKAAAKRAAAPAAAKPVAKAAAKTAKAVKTTVSAGRGRAKG